MKEDRHWLQGGSGIANFNKEDLQFYIRAIDEYKDDNLYISLPTTFAGERPDNLYGLHRHTNTKTKDADLSNFWRIYETIKFGKPAIEPTDKKTQLICRLIQESQDF
jgi:hypothetical protein